jgi:F420H(2)-dependent quinone reductase
MAESKTASAKLPPAWFVHTFWRLHRALYRLSGGRFLWTTASKRDWGALHLTTIGRRSGRERSVILGYLEDGPNVVTLAMNGWDEGHPAWWLNLEAHPDAVVRLPRHEARPVRARAAVGDERDRLWQRWAAVDTNLDAYAARRSITTPVVVLEPRSEPLAERDVASSVPASSERRNVMDPDRKTAKVVGALFIVATGASILGSVVLGSVVDEPRYLTTLAGAETHVIASAMLFVIAALSAFATAFLLFPILRRHAEGLAAGYLGLRAFENVFYVASVVALLMMLTVSQSDAVGAAKTSDTAVFGAVLLALRDWSNVLGTLLFAGVGAVILNSVLYRSRLVPRWLSLWGVVGGALLVLYGVLGVFDVDVDLGSPSTLLAMPIAVQEMVFAGWLLTKGFATRTVAPEATGDVAGPFGRDERVESGADHLSLPV